jgi:prepilin-type N-terminal cleavage/methylation domain-containing protein
MLFLDSKQQRANAQKFSRLRRPGNSGFTMPEILVAVFVIVITTAIAVPIYNATLRNWQMNSMAGAITGAISSTRYQALSKSQIYTLAITAPANTYVVTNVSTNTAGTAVPLPSNQILVNGGTGTSTFTLCPNGVVYGAGGTCVTGNPAPPTISISYNNRTIAVNVSSVGNVSTKITN